MYLSTIEACYYILGSISLIAALVVVTARNAIHRIASLVVVFTAGAFIFMLLDFYFLGLTYIIVYVGAIAILFLFTIMMVNLPSGTENISAKTKSDKGVELSVLYLKISKIFKKKERRKLKKEKTNNHLSCLEVRHRDNPIYGSPNIKAEGLKLSTLRILTALYIILTPILLYISLDYDIKNYYDFASVLVNLKSYTYSYFYPIWALEYKTITDIESLAITIYVAYPLALLLIGVALWTVMVGIISICSPRI